MDNLYSAPGKKGEGPRTLNLQGALGWVEDDRGKVPSLGEISRTETCPLGYGHDLYVLVPRGGWDF